LGVDAGFVGIAGHGGQRLFPEVVEAVLADGPHRTGGESFALSPNLVAR
jgi:hypothetical protein